MYLSQLPFTTIIQQPKPGQTHFKVCDGLSTWTYDSILSGNALTPRTSPYSMLIAIRTGPMH